MHTVSATRKLVTAHKQIKWMDQGNPSSETGEIIHSVLQQCDAAAKAKLNKSRKLKQKKMKLIYAGNRLPGPPLYAATPILVDFFTAAASPRH
jgi:hypothetical protein